MGYLPEKYQGDREDRPYNTTHMSEVAKRVYGRDILAVALVLLPPI